MIYKFIDDHGAEITVNSLSQLQTLVDSKTIKKNTKVKAGLRGKWGKAKDINELKFEEEKKEESEKETEDIESFITSEPTPPPKKETITKTEKPKVHIEEDKIVDTKVDLKSENKQPKERIVKTDDVIEPSVKQPSEVAKVEQSKIEKEELENFYDDDQTEDTKEDKDFFIKVLWRGNYSLKQSFWAFYLLPVLAFAFLIFLLMPTVLLPNAYVGVSIIYYLIVFTAIFYSILSMVGTWKSAIKFTNKKKLLNKPYGWAIAAQIFIVLDVVSRIVNIANTLNE